MGKLFGGLPACALYNQYGPSETHVVPSYRLTEARSKWLNSFQNERQRLGTWLFLSQELTPNDSIHFGWAHAFKTPGDPGQHNDAIVPTPDGASFVASNNNQADMVTASYKHRFSENLTWYTAVAATFNGPSAHYDLGAGGRGVTTDCHDASGADGGNVFGNPHCFTGTTLVGVSTGLQWRF